MTLTQQSYEKVPILGILYMFFEISLVNYFF